MAKYNNRLSQESSPYLLQHADNPVDWWPWCSEAFELAQKTNKLVLLSVGYSACHWCHVMAHESFEDEETAKLINKQYISIKVDREERPDLDKIYQSAHQVLVQRPGGWPLTAILTPHDQRPFFIGTYFPLQARHGLPAFCDILQQVTDFYRDNPQQVSEQNENLVNAMAAIGSKSASTTASSEADKISPVLLDLARKQLEQHFDNKFGGFGSAPKFPHPSNLDRLLRHWHSSLDNQEEDKKARDMLMLTLHAFASGGIIDQLAGGFFRYSVDDQWIIPHFEKMLYDNGPLLSLFADAYSAFGNKRYKCIAIQTADWIIRDMQNSNGAYYSTLDADTEGSEGKFYIWDTKQVKTLIPKQDYDIIADYFSLNNEANFEGQYHLHISMNETQLAEKYKRTKIDIVNIIANAKGILYKERQTRIHPDRDEKILCAWNALAIKGMANAGRRLNCSEYIASAQNAVDFIYDNMFKDGRLYACYKDDTAYNMGMLDDYAFLLDALIELLQADWRTADLNFAITLANCLLEHFEDGQEGGFFFTANDHEKLIHRPKPISDEAIPSGNAIAAYALNRLYYLSGDSRYQRASERTIQFANESIKQMPYAFAALLHAVEEQLYPPQIIIVRGKPENKSVWLKDLNTEYCPRRLSFYIDKNESNLPSYLLEKKPHKENDMAYICDGLACRAPIMDHQQLKEQL